MKGHKLFIVRKERGVVAAITAVLTTSGLQFKTTIKHFYSLPIFIHSLFILISLTVCT